MNPREGLQETSGDRLEPLRWFTSRSHRVASVRPDESSQWVEVVPAVEFDRLWRTLEQIAENDNVEASKRLAREAVR